jgi:hypothetical protein
MASDPEVAYEFAQFTLLPTEKRLLCEGKAVPLAPKVFDTLGSAQSAVHTFMTDRGAAL